MNPICKRLIPALLTLGVAFATQVTWPSLTSPMTREGLLDTDGFIPRWLLLEPIATTGLTPSAVQAAAKKEYFPNQFTVIPRDGDKVMVGGSELTSISITSHTH
jgi:hypothetical protein